MSLGPGIIMFGPGDPASQGVYLAVEDLDGHYKQARAAGAEIIREIEDTDYGSPRVHRARSRRARMEFWHLLAGGRRVTTLSPDPPFRLS